MSKTDEQQRVEALTEMLDKLFKDEKVNVAARAAAASLTRLGASEGTGCVATVRLIGACELARPGQV